MAEPEPGQLAIETHELSKRFGSFTAVRDVCLAVARGDIFGFLGPNGAGKTTTMRMLLGLLQPSAGRVLVLGYDMSSQAERVRQRLGYVSQRFGLYSDLSVEENMAFYARVYGVPREAFATRCQRVLEATGLAEVGGVPARALPGGYRQRLALACATLHEPLVLFLDEPTAGVDPISRQVLWDFLRQLADEGRTVFVTTHYMDEAENCRHLAIIDQGRIVLCGSPAGIRGTLAGQVIEVQCDRPEDGLALLLAARGRGQLPVMDLSHSAGAIRLVGGADGQWPTLAEQILLAGGVSVRAVQPGEPTLEDAFLLAVGGLPAGSQASDWRLLERLELRQ